MDEVLSSLPDAGNLEIRSYFRAEGFLSLKAIHSPEMGGISYLNLVIEYEEVNGLICFPGENDMVVAGEFELGAKITADVGSAQKVGLR